MRRQEISRLGEVSSLACRKPSTKAEIAALDAALLFQAWRGIECLAGACLASLELQDAASTKIIERSMRMLLKPNAKSKSRFIADASKLDVYSVSSFPSPDSLRLSEDERAVVQTACKGTIDRMGAALNQVSSLAGVLKGPRNTYAHNYRFIPLDAPEPVGSFLILNEGTSHAIVHATEHLSMIGVLDEHGNKSRILITNDDRDTMVTGVYSWSQLESWIYQNMANTILNRRVVLPKAESFLFRPEKNLERDYENVRQRLGHRSYQLNPVGWDSVHVYYTPSAAVTSDSAGPSGQV